MMRVHELSQNECMFALLEMPSSRGRDRDRELLYQFEAFVPQDVGDVHAVFSGPVDGKVIACGCSLDRVLRFQSEVEMLVPDLLPDWLGIESSDAICWQLNLLGGVIKPASFHQRERVTAKIVCFASVVIILMVVLGVQRKKSVLDEQLADINTQIASMYQQVLPRSSGSNTQPDAIRLSTLLNQARATRTGATGLAEHDLVGDLAGVFENWPRAIYLQVRALTLNERTLRIELSISGNEVASEVVRVLSGLNGWEIETRSTNPRSDHVDLSVTLVRSAQTENQS